MCDKSGHPLIFREFDKTEQGVGSRPKSRIRHCAHGVGIKTYRKYECTLIYRARCRRKGKSAGWRIACQWRTRGEKKSDLSERTRARMREFARGCERVREIHELSVIRRPDQCRSVPRSARQVAPLRHSVHILGEERSHMRTVKGRPSCVLGLRQRREICQSIHSTSRPPCPFSRTRAELATSARVLPLITFSRDHDRTSSGTDEWYRADLAASDRNRLSLFANDGVQSQGC